MKFGVPGAGILASMALPRCRGILRRLKQWVILWQGVTIVLCTSLIAFAATSLKAAAGW